jgi:hydroxypyruvate isomerase
MRIKPDVNLSILFAELALPQRPAAAAACGFEAVELWWPFDRSVPREAQLRDLAEALHEAGTSLVGLNFDAGDMASGDRGLVSLPGQQTRLRENIEVAIDFAEPLGCKAFNALYGNRLEGTDPSIQDELAIENLSYAATAVQRIGGMVLVETQNTQDSPRYPLTRSADAMAVIERVEQACGAGNVNLLADLYHLHRMGENLAATVTAFAERIGHVQVADDPGRHQPGTGDIDFGPALSALASVGYEGYLGLEYRSLGPSSDSFGWLSLHPWTAGITWRSPR